MNVSMEHMCDDIDKKIKVLRKQHVPVPLCPPQIPHGLTFT